MLTVMSKKGEQRMPGGAHTKEAENTFILMESDFKCLIVYYIFYLTCSIAC